MYDVVPFIPSKGEDWDNGCGGPTERADIEAMRYARVLSPMGEAVWEYLQKNAEAHGRAVARTVELLVGASESKEK